jgi:glycosyltransferase involved in cell wall biosynthesis
MTDRSLRVLHAVGWYFPESSGGTEVYVDALARHLARHDVESSIVAATDETMDTDYQWNGRAVHRYMVPPPASGELANGRPHVRFDEFERWLRQQRVDVYHQHSWTRGCGVDHLRAARRLGLKTVLTVHVPGVVCLRGTMMLRGAEACNGRVQVARCTSCWGEARGIPGAVTSLQERWPEASAALGRLARGRLRTALATPALVKARINDLAEIGSLADRVVVVSRWLRDVLVGNGMAETQVVYSAQGIDPATIDGSSATKRSRGGPFRVGFLGRWDPVKGIDTVVRAVLALPSHPAIELRVYALPGDADYERRVHALAGRDPRIHFEQPLARHEVSAALHDLDLLAVPSRWLETGPLVALEAFAAGCPVLGSDLGGLKELVIPGVNGQLVPAADEQGWTRAISAMAAAPPLIIPKPRTTASVAADMLALYGELVAQA